jgi:hypothetical protein
MLVLICLALWRDAHIPCPEKPLVAKKGGIEPFHVIGIADLRLTCESDTTPSAKRAGTMVGRYSFEYLKSCEPMDVGRLSSGDRLSGELKDRVLVRLKVQPTSLFHGMNPPFRAVVVGSPSERGTTALLENDLIVMDLQKDGDGWGAVLAVPSADEPTLVTFMSRSDLLLAAEHR